MRLALLFAIALTTAGCSKSLRLNRIDSSAQKPSNVAVYFTVDTADGDPRSQGDRDDERTGSVMGIGYVAGAVRSGAVLRFAALLGVLTGCRFGFGDPEIESDAAVVDSESVDAESVEPMIAGHRVLGSWGTANLTGDGQIDWRHWGYGGAGNRNRKIGGSAISDYMIIGPGPIIVSMFADPVSWTDGTPTLAATTTDYVLVDTPRLQGDGFKINVAADTAMRKLTLYVANFCVRMRVEAAFDDDSGVPFVDTTWERTGPSSENVRYEIDFVASSTARVLEVTMTIDMNHCTTGDLGEAKLMAATLR